MKTGQYLTKMWKIKKQMTWFSGNYIGLDQYFIVLIVLANSFNFCWLFRIFRLLCRQQKLKLLAKAIKTI